VAGLVAVSSCALTHKRPGGRKVTTVMLERLPTDADRKRSAQRQSGAERRKYASLNSNGWRRAVVASALAALRRSDPATVPKSAARTACQSPLCLDSDQILQRVEMTRWANCGHAVAYVRNSYVQCMARPCGTRWTSKISESESSQSQF
jgi:hypothetical protein